MDAFDTSLPIRRPGRRFELWRYLVSHGQLLLRSNKGDGHARRIDILFKNVKRMDLPTLMDDVEITIATEDQVPAAARDLGSHRAAGGGIVYRVAGRGFAGYVVAGFVGVVEDDGEFNEPSSFNAPGL